MIDFFKNHKKQCIIAAVLSVIVFAVYLRLLFLPGFWYRAAFLYKQKAPFEGIEVYSGKDKINDVRYEMTMAKEGMKTYIAFTVNETERGYEIVSDNSENHNPEVEIFENGELVFKGTSIAGMLFDENDEPFSETPLKDYYTPGSLSEKELLPTYNWLYEVSQRIKPEIRGNVIFLPAIILFAAAVLFDMMHPDVFWALEHRLAVEGGRPSDYYRWIQKAGWVLSPFIIIALMILSFVITA